MYESFDVGRAPQSAPHRLRLVGLLAAAASVAGAVLLIIR
jgi:hypothetical protein